MTDILECLKKYGQWLDLEIVSETGEPLATVRERLMRQLFRLLFQGSCVDSVR